MKRSHARSSVGKKEKIKLKNKKKFKKLESCFSYKINKKEHWTLKMLPKMPIQNNGDKPTFADEPTFI